MLDLSSPLGLQRSTQIFQLLRYRHGILALRQLVVVILVYSVWKHRLVEGTKTVGQGELGSQDIVAIRAPILNAFPTRLQNEEIYRNINLIPTQL